MTRLLIAFSFAAAWVMVSSQAHAQTAQASQRHTEAPGSRGVTFGTFWSTNFASASVPPGLDVIGRQWSGGGGSVEVPLAGGLSFDGRVMWNRKGGRVPLPGGVGFQEVSADYLSAPLLVRLSGPTRLRPYAVGGLEVAFRLSARSRLMVGVMDVTERSTDDIQPLDLAAAMGGGIERTLGRSAVFVEALYSHGLRNVFADPSDVAYAKTRTVTLLAGVRF